MRAWPIPLLLTACLPLRAQTPEPATPAGQAPTITVQSQLVLVPVNVQTKKGDTLYGLTADDFTIEADGVPQRVRLDEAEDVRPISLAVLVQCSRDAAMEWDKIKGLPVLVDQIVGGAPAHVAVVDFGLQPELLTGFTQNPDRRNRALTQLKPCPDDGSTSTLDAVDYANKLFEHAHEPGRRVILLVSETRDHGSQTKAAETIRDLNRANVLVDAVTFSPARDSLKEDVIHNDGPYSGVLGGVVGLLGAAIQSLRKNVPKELSRQTGGEYINFGSEKKFDQGLNGLANRVGNYYLLSFQPRFPPAPAEDPNRFAGPLHGIRVRVKPYPDAVVRARESYWTDTPAAASAAPAPAEP